MIGDRRDERSWLLKWSGFRRLNNDLHLYLKRNYCVKWCPSSIDYIIIPDCSFCLWNISQISDFPRIRLKRGEFPSVERSEYNTLQSRDINICHYLNQPPPPGTGQSHWSPTFFSQTTCRSAYAGWRLSHNDVMDLDTLLCIKFWANGCIVSYDILVTDSLGGRWVNGGQEQLN